MIDQSPPVMNGKEIPQYQQRHMPGSLTQSLAATEEPVLVLHVKNGYEARGLHIEKMLERLGMKFEFFLDGDVPDMPDDFTRRTVRGRLAGESAGVQSCAYKHLLTCRYILARGWEGALILEDDISLCRDFVSKFRRTLEEYRRDCDRERPTILSYDGSILRFVPHSQRRRGKLLYKGPHDRYTGAFYINAAACRAVLETVESRGMHQPIDTYHTYMIEEGLLDYYWSEPPLAVQGSFNGDFPSSLSVRKKWLGQGKAQRALVWWLKTRYKRLLYRFR